MMFLFIRKESITPLVLKLDAKNHFSAKTRGIHITGATTWLWRAHGTRCQTLNDRDRSCGQSFCGKPLKKHFSPEKVLDARPTNYLQKWWPRGFKQVTYSMERRVPNICTEKNILFTWIHNA